jgi:hypothetical protein
MRPQPFENNYSQQKEKCRDNPEIKGIQRMLPERHIKKEAVPVPVYKVKKRVDPEISQVLFTHAPGIPENGSKEEQHPHYNGDDIIDIGEKQ